MEEPKKEFTELEIPEVGDATGKGGIDSLQCTESNGRLYRETGSTGHSREGESSGAVMRHGVVITATQLGNRVVIDLYATNTDSSEIAGEKEFNHPIGEEI